MAYFYQGNISPLELSVNGTSKFKGVGASTPGILQVYDNNSTNYAQIQAPPIISTNYTLTLPTNDGDANQFLQTNGSGALTWTSASTLSNGADNRLITSNNLNEINGEPNLLFDGTNLRIEASGQAQFRSSGIHIASNAASTLTATSDGTINLVSADRTTFITATSNIASVDTTGIDLANGKSYQIDNTDVLTSTSLGSGVVGSSLTSVGTLNGLTVQSSDNNADIIKLHADAGALQTITVVNDAGTSNSAIALTSNAGGITIDASSNLVLNSSAGDISIGNNTNAQNINVGTGGAARTIVIGNNNISTALSLTSGTGGHIVGSAGGVSLNSSGGSISIGNDDVDQPINIGTQGKRTISIGTGGFPDIINIGNNNTTTAVSITSGTGSIALASTDTGDITINSDDTLLLDAGGILELNSSAGAISIGNDADAQAINIGTGGASRTITLGNATGATAVSITSGTGDITLNPSASSIITKDIDSEFVALKLINQSDANNTTGIVSLEFDLEDTGGTVVDAGKIAVKKNEAFTATGTTQNSNMVFSTSLNGTLTENMTLSSDGSLNVIGDIDIANGKTYKINNIDVLTATSLGSNVVVSGLTSVGTIGTGVWEGTAIASAYLDVDTAYLSGTQTFTGDKTFSSATTTIDGDITITGCITQGSDASGDMYYRNASGVLTRIAVGSGSDNHVLTLNGAVPGWEAVASISSSTDTFTVSKDVDGEFVALKLINQSDANNTTGIVSLEFDLEDTGGTVVDAGKIAVKKNEAFTATGTTQDSNMVFSTSLNGTLTENMTLSSDGNLSITDNMTLATNKYLEWGPYTGTGNDSYIKASPGSMTLRGNSIKLIAVDTEIWSDISNRPYVYITNYGNNSTGGSLILRNLRAGISGQNGDVCGTIAFNANDDGTPTNKTFAEVKVVATAATSGSEQGTMTIGVACTDDGGVDTVLTITGGVDAASSTTTIAGNLDIEGDIDMATGKKITWVDDNQYISGTATGITIETDDTLVVNADTSMTFDAPSVIFQSSTSAKPVLEIKNTNADTTGPTLLLNNANGTAAGSDTDVCGTIAFNANDDDGSSPTNQSFATIIGTAVDTATTSEKGKIEIGVACTGDGGVDTVLTITGGAAAASSTTMIAGNVLVGATSFTKNCKLWVEGGHGTNQYLEYSWFIPGPTLGWSITTRNTLRIGCDGPMIATEVNVFSDERMKKDFITLQTTEAFDKISQIIIYNYKLKRELDYGPQYLGVKAQEVELFYPECVSEITDVLPTIMEMVVYNNKKFVLTSIGDIAIGDKLKILYQNKTNNNRDDNLIASVVNVVGNEVEIDTVIDDDDDEIYIYGKEYDDVKVIDYNKLNLMSIGAIQKLITDKTELETKVATLETKATALESDVATLKSQVATLIANSP